MVITKRQLEVEAIFLISMAAAVSIFFVVYKNNNFSQQFNVLSPLPTQNEIEVVAPRIATASQISPDGVKKVIMKVTENLNGTKTYDFSTADGDGLNEQHIFTKTLDSLNSITLPFNTWSPDDKYFFVQENLGNIKNVLVFKALGEQFSAEEDYLNATDSFIQKDTGNNFDTATGWASETLIIMNTTKPDNTKGPSYWFEVPSKAIIRLSTEF
ncbi:MAG: hypothetical protein Q8P26_02035 [Candidatus Levybacteria bacterium]|nr:hypothetical protein [Candidatus Levybacteria bacterium]